MPKEIAFEKLKLEKQHCRKCGHVLCKTHLISGIAIIEVKCYSCNTYNTIYLEKKEVLDK